MTDDILLAILALAIAMLCCLPAPPANALPSCQYEDGSTGTECLWTVERDGIVSLLPACVNEDGNEDGQPCLWFDPDTRNAFYVTSEDYR